MPRDENNVEVTPVEEVHPADHTAEEKEVTVSPEGVLPPKEEELSQ